MTEKLKLIASPFPGMDPYLEAPDIWPDFHDRLAGVLSAMLNELLPQRYYARIQKRPELGVVLEAGILRRIVPDVTVLRRTVREVQTAYVISQARVVVDKPRTVATPGIEFRIRTDPIQHHFVEIRDAQMAHKVVTVIEIVSPSNKQPGPDRRSYETKQQEVLSSDANLIELDLLRAGRRLLPYPELVAFVDELHPDYLVVLNRNILREGYWMDFTLYPVNLREMLPCIPVPLANGDPDVLLDLRVAAIRTYQDGPYLRLVDYSAEPVPSLKLDDAAWADEMLRAAGLR
jgi:hypothetical protein